MQEGTGAGSCCRYTQLCIDAWCVLRVCVCTHSPMCHPHTHHLLLQGAGALSTIIENNAAAVVDRWAHLGLL